MKRSISKVELKEKQRLALENQQTTHRGLVGLFETALRKAKNLTHVAALVPVYSIGVVIIGLALTPAIRIFHEVSEWSVGAEPWLKAFAFGCAAGLGFFAYGFTLIVLIPIFNFVMRTHLVPWRGGYYSFGSVRWYIHNCLTYLARYTFLEFITPTPFNLWFYRAMGMKIGRGAQLNTTNVSDPSLIELGERATVGGSATLIAHYATGGFLIIAPLKIGKGATIGLKATLMGGVEIGDYAVVLPNSVVLPKTVIPAGEIWGGVPAARISQRERPKKAA
jgi:acetyltransferase-like isoleucine patch superfamily enzyme